MSLRGKLIGAAVGFTAGGPLGAAVGAVLGEHLSKDPSPPIAAVCPHCLKELKIPQKSRKEGTFQCPQCRGLFLFARCSHCNSPFTADLELPYLCCPRCRQLSPGLPIVQAFQLLELSPSTDDPKQIKARYFQLAAQYHPDKNPSHGQKIALLNRAHHLVSEFLKAKCQKKSE